jgi:hypothetical protein
MTDFIDGLRGDLIDAAELHRRRGPVRRTLPLLPPVWRPALAVATAVAGAVGVLFAANSLSPAPAPQPTVALRVQLGGQPEDAVLAGGSLWVTDFEGRVLRVDRTSGEVTGRTAVIGNPRSIAAGADGLWVTSPGLTQGAGSVVSRIDPASGRVVDRLRVGGHVEAVAAGAGGVWLVDARHRRLVRTDPSSHERTARVPFARAGTVAATESTLWAIGDDGALVAVDGVSLAVHRLRGAVAFGHGPAENTLAADGTGAWVVGRGDGTVLQIEGGQVIARVAVDDALGPIAVGDGVVWVVSGDPDAAGSYRLAQIDPATGEVTGSLDVGRSQPKALVANGGDVWAIAADGTAVLVSAHPG